MKLDRRWAIIFLAGIVALISIGASASVSLSGGCTSIIEGSDSVRGISTPDGTDITATGSIQAAVNVAPPGATVSLLPKTYNEIVEISKSLDIIGAGKSSTIVDGQQKGSVFTIPSGVTAKLVDMTIQNGKGDLGGGIYNSGTATLTDSIVSGNTDTGTGGGIRNDGTMTVADSIISNNIALFKGGGIYNCGTMTVADSIISGNIGGTDGGGILNEAKVTVIGSTISKNCAEVGGGISSWDTGSTVTVISSTISGNCASTIGGGIYNGPTSNAKVIGSTISGNSATNGGGIYNLGPATVTDSIVSGNIASGSGGGIYNSEMSDFYNSGKLTITDSIVSENSATLGGGIYWTDLRPVIDSKTIITGNSEPQIYPY